MITKVQKGGLKMTEERFNQVCCDILNNNPSQDMIDFVFYKVEKKQKYWDVLGCALYQLGVYDNETMLWRDYLEYDHLHILSSIEEKIDLYMNEEKPVKLDLTADETNVISYAITIYQSVLHTIYREKIIQQLKELLGKFTNELKEGRLEND